MRNEWLEPCLVRIARVVEGKKKRLIVARVTPPVRFAVAEVMSTGPSRKPHRCFVDYLGWGLPPQTDISFDARWAEAQLRRKVVGSGGDGVHQHLALVVGQGLHEKQAVHEDVLGNP